jgi:hypothetical protein
MLMLEVVSKFQAAQPVKLKINPGKGHEMPRETERVWV